MLVLFNLASRTFRGHFAPRDTICVVFCGVHKSLTLGRMKLFHLIKRHPRRIKFLFFNTSGIPMLSIMYEDDPNLPLICLPLLVYHPTQILLGGLLVPYLRRYLKRKDTGWEKKSCFSFKFDRKVKAQLFLPILLCSCMFNFLGIWSLPMYCDVSKY